MDPQRTPPANMPNVRRPRERAVLKLPQPPKITNDRPSLRLFPEKFLLAQPEDRPNSSVILPAKNSLRAGTTGPLFDRPAPPKHNQPEGPAMASITITSSDTNHSVALSANTGESDEDDHLREVLKRCPASTYHAACQFKRTGDTRHLPAIVFGIIERFVESSLRSKLHHPTDSLRLIEDLGIDSLTLMEIVMLVEDVLALTIRNEELRALRTLGEVRQFLEGKLRQQPLAETA